MENNGHTIWNLGKLSCWTHGGEGEVHTTMRSKLYRTCSVMVQIEVFDNKIAFEILLNFTLNWFYQRKVWIKMTFFQTKHFSMVN